MVDELATPDPDNVEAKPTTGELIDQEAFASQTRHDRRVVKQILTRYEGPIPPPSMLRELDSIVPGLAERIANDVFEQSTHRRSLEKGLVDSAIESRKHGMWIGGGLGAIGLVGAVVVGCFGQPVLGTALVTAVAGGLVTSFFGARDRQQKEMAAKAAEKDRIDQAMKASPPAKVASSPNVKATPTSS